MKVVDYPFDPKDPTYPRFKIYADDWCTRPFDTIDYLEGIVYSLGLRYGDDYVVRGESMICFYKEEHRTMFLLKYKPVDNS